MVRVLNGLDFREANLSITKGADGYGLQIAVTDGSGTVMIASCKNPDRLGRWALDGGAKAVRHDYDCTSKGDAERAAQP